MQQKHKQTCTYLVILFSDLADRLLDGATFNESTHKHGHPCGPMESNGVQWGPKRRTAWNNGIPIQACVL